MSLTKYQKQSPTETIRSTFKDSLTKLLSTSTREQAIKQLKHLIKQNKTTLNLRIWLSVLAQSRNKHNESQILIFTYIVEQYGKGLLDPLDKVPSLEKTVFRITELLIRLFFVEESANVMLALQKAWVELYRSTMSDQDPQTKRKLLYNCLQAILNGGADKMSQMTAQVVLDGLLEATLNNQDLLFFKEIAKRTIVLFLKTTIIHPSTLTCLQIVLSYFNINNLIPLLQNIINKILSYVNLAPVNSVGYKIKAEVCNVLAVIGEQIDQNGVGVMERVGRVLENLATDKVWAVQVTGRKALNVWKKKGKEWQKEYMAKNQQVFAYPTAQQFYNPSMHEQEDHPAPSFKDNRPKVLTADHFYQRQQEKPNQNEYKVPDYSQGKYLHKNTGIGGGNNVQSVEHHYQKQQKPQQETYSRKMEEIKKSIYQPKKDYTEYDETLPVDQVAKSMPFPTTENKQSFLNKKQESKMSEIPTEKMPEFDFSQDKEQLKIWQTIMELYEQGKKEESIKVLLQLDDDIYFLRFMLKYSKGLLKDVTRSTSAKILKQLLAIKKTNFMEQLFFKLVVESSKVGVGSLLTNQQNLQISQKLQKCKKIQSLQKISTKVKKAYEKSLIE